MLHPKIYDPLRPSSEDIRPTLLLQNFAEGHHPLRKVAIESFKGLYDNLRIVHGVKGSTESFDKYLKAMSQSKFVLSPPGKSTKMIMSH